MLLQKMRLYKVLFPHIDKGAIPQQSKHLLHLAESPHRVSHNEMGGAFCMVGQ